MQKIFASEFMGGFECSTHINHQHRRVDVIDWTKHDLFAEADYRRLIQLGMKTARDGVRWHLIEKQPYEYDFSTIANQVRAAQTTGIQIIWDLFHYGYPNDLDILSREFVNRFRAFSVAFTEFLIAEGTTEFFFCPVNEISFYSWIAGGVGGFYPFLHGRGDDLKRNLVRAAISSIEAIRKICPFARFIHTDPAIHITAASDDPHEIGEAEIHRQGQFHALDMMCGKREPELGGKPEHLDVIGLNYYFNNQWRAGTGRRVFRDAPDYKPFREILKEFQERYERPILIAETGIENEERADWFRFVCEQVEQAKSAGAQIEGVCLYPVVNHPGWDDERHCHNGLWDYADSTGNREIYEPLAAEIKRQINLREKTNAEEFTAKAAA